MTADQLTSLDALDLVRKALLVLLSLLDLLVLDLLSELLELSLFPGRFRLLDARPGESVLQPRQKV